MLTSNLLTQREGKWTMFLANYKNYRHSGVDVTEFDTELHGTLPDLLDKWLSTYRTLMVPQSPQAHRFIFVTKHGKPFGQAYFSEYLAHPLCKLTGQSVGANILRSSFISYFYGAESSESDKGSASYAMRESVAKAMRHSASQAEKTYDRRTVMEKKHKGMECLAQCFKFPHHERQE
jgi:hypothetical protein